MNWIEWYRIVAYKDFHDVPRLVLVANAAEDKFYVLDAGFDDAIDNDSAIYTIHDVGSDLGEATASFERHAGESLDSPAIGCIPVEHVEFDETRRAALKLTSPPIV
jgi:hypothetical protein